MGGENCAKKRKIQWQKVLNVKYPLKSGLWDYQAAF